LAGTFYKKCIFQWIHNIVDHQAGLGSTGTGSIGSSHGHGPLQRFVSKKKEVALLHAGTGQCRSSQTLHLGRRRWPRKLSNQCLGPSSSHTLRTDRPPARQRPSKSPIHHSPFPIPNGGLAANWYRHAYIIAGGRPHPSRCRGGPCIKAIEARLLCQTKPNQTKPKPNQSRRGCSAPVMIGPNLANHLKPSSGFLLTG
jgi:hypothetical protein